MSLSEKKSWSHEKSRELHFVLLQKSVQLGTKCDCMICPYNDTIISTGSSCQFPEIS